MKILYQDINNRQIILDIPNNGNIEYIKFLAQDHTGNHPDTQNLYFNDIELCNEKLLSDYNIKENSLIINRIKKINIDYSNLNPIEIPFCTNKKF